jgi:hypothetical protein
MFGPAFSQFNPGRRGGGMAPSPIIMQATGLRTAFVIFNHADFIAITEKTIVPAVANYWINPIWWSSQKSIPVTPYAPTNVPFLLGYAGSTSISRLTGLTPVMTSAGTRIDRNGTTAGAALDPASLAVGKALIVRNPTANGAGAAANKVRFMVVYELIPSLP